MLLLPISPSTVFSGEVDPNKEYRVALVIGNSDYKHAPLRNPVNDAKDIASSLQDLGFEVVLGTNLNRQQIQEKVKEFSPMLAKADVAFFYFAGHGFQYQGENFLVPVAYNINNDSEIPREALSTATILKKMDKAGNAINIVILDACRNNPFEQTIASATRSLTFANNKHKPSSRGLKRSSSQGLSRISGPSGSFIAYATAPGHVAADGNGKNGLYTLHLLDFMSQTGLSIEQVFKKVRIGVIKDTQGQQVPWENSSLLGDFYFVEVDDGVSKSLNMDFMSQNDQEQKKKQQQDQIELQFWSSIEKSNTPALFKSYLDKYPQGHFVEIASIKMEILKQKQKTVNVIASSQKRQSPQPKLQPEQNMIIALSEALEVAVVEHKKEQKLVEESQHSPFKTSDFVNVSSGCFTMGSPFGEEARQNDELDHKVCISNDFKMGKYEVTQAQWRTIMGRNPAYFKGCGTDCPVERVSWNDVQTFIFRLNIISNAHYRLPTEAEWEYAARSGTSTSTYVGDLELDGSNSAPGLDKIAWYSGNTKVKYKGGKYCEDWDEKQYASVRCGTQKVGKKRPNSWGLYDMIGNVWELTNDWYGNFSSKSSHDPQGSKRGSLKVAKGGNWSDSLQQNRAAARYGFSVKEKSNNLGFRLVRN